MNACDAAAIANGRSVTRAAVASQHVAWHRYRNELWERFSGWTIGFAEGFAK